MTPIFNEYLSMLKDFNIDLSEYKPNSLWIDRLIVKGFDKEGNIQKICRLSVTDDLEYIHKFYDKKPQPSSLMTWEETYNFFVDEISLKENESLSVIESAINAHPNHQIILTTSMGKDSKLVQCLVDKVTNNYRLIFNNTTLDCVDVYYEALHTPKIEIVNPVVKDPRYKSFYEMVPNFGTPTRFARWCCSTFKEGATKEYFEGVHNLLFFYGMRNEESANRANYDYDFRNIAWTDDTWMGCLPIRKWTEVELWLYTIHNNIPINTKYKRGYTRVGCHIACPYYTKATWILDKYWYPYGYKRWHTILAKDFMSFEKWYRLNCTLDEYHLNWNGGLVREEPTEEVVAEFAEYKGIDDLNVARKYFNKTCERCNKKVTKKNEVAMNLKYFGRNTNRILCKKCLMAEMGWTKEDWDAQVERFKSQGCTLF